MRTVDDPAVILRVLVGLGTELEAEVLDDIVWRTSKLVGDVAQVHNDSLDAVTLALDLGLQALHLVAVEGIGDIPANVDVGHDCVIVDC